MVIAMGLVYLPSVLDCFVTEPILSHLLFPSILSKDRFLLISKYSHVSDDTQFPGDKLGKLRPFIDHLVRNQMIDTRCRVSFIQYMPKSQQSLVWRIGYWQTQFFLMCAIFKFTPKKMKERPNTVLAHRVIMDLVEPYLKRGHRLFMDNFYSSPTLYQQLWEKNAGIWNSQTGQERNASRTIE